MFLVEKTLTRNVSEILIHPNYSACDASSNHAILRLIEPFPLNHKLNIICLPTFDQISLAGDCGYTLININSRYLWNIPGESNTCELMDISMQDGAIYVHSSCERGKNNTDLILDISAQLESCEIPRGSDQFFYFGMNIDILYNCNHRTIIMSKNDNLYDNLNWITSILRDKF
ncbi:uncharacterized protein [Chelonus insularis]|uniref:uncharacterized protein n=1 Tax=Chelonus insularis TaxID=460826 RepID=UPI00158D1E41|nr:uncharacterized protein LOC118069930 [Chelonus insularis]